MKMQRSVLSSSCIPTRRACCSGAAPDPYNTTGLKAWNREGKVDGMTSKGHGCYMATATQAHCSQEPEQAPARPFFRCGSVQQWVFPPAQLWNPSKGREASGHAPARWGGQINQRGPLSQRPQLFFLLVWALLAHQVFLSCRNVPLSWHACRDPRAS